MITLTRLSGSEFILNSDLIERVESTPDTVITLVDGTKYVVAESPTDIVRAVRRYRAEIVAFASSGTPAEEPPSSPNVASALATVSVLPSGPLPSKHRSREA